MITQDQIVKTVVAAHGGEAALLVLILMETGLSSFINDTDAAERIKVEYGTYGYNLVDRFDV